MSFEREERRTRGIPFTREFEEARRALWELCQRICPGLGASTGAAMGEAP